MTTLSQEEIRKLYNTPDNQDGVVAFGRAIPIKPTKRATRSKLPDLDFGSKAYDAEYDRMMKSPSKPVAPVLESEVVELI